MNKYVMDRPNGQKVAKAVKGGRYVRQKEIFTDRSPRSPLRPQSPPLSPESDSLDLAIDGAVNTSMEQLYRNICDMQSSDQSPSRCSFYSYGEESRIDSELLFVAGGYYSVLESRKDDEAEQNEEDPNICKDDSEDTRKASLSGQSCHGRPPNRKQVVRGSRRLENGKMTPFVGKNCPSRSKNHAEAGFHGHYLLKQARDMIVFGDNSQKALEFALRAMKLLEGSTSLDFVMCLHVVAALYCRLGRYTDAIPVLERSIDIPVIDLGQDHAIAKFAGCMQLGDTYRMLGQIENSLLMYAAGLEIQRQVLGEKDRRFGDTCRYLAEAHIQAMEFEEAEKLCLMALGIHKGISSLASPEEAVDRRLLGLICESKRDYEGALENYVLARSAMAANGPNADVAAIDCNIGNAYLSLARYEEANLAYQKALDTLKSSKGENHSLLASVFVGLADLHNKTGKVPESKSFCEKALRIYDKPMPGSPKEEIASGLVDISAIYESMNEPNRALLLLQKAIKIYANVPGQHSIIAAIEAQMGVLYYMLGNYSESYKTLKSATSKFKAVGENKSALFGIALNQMGLACVELFFIDEAADLFEEARTILEAEYGPYHADTLGVYSNLAGAYDVMGRTADAIKILDYVVQMREHTRGIAAPDVEDETNRLTELLKEAGMIRNRKSR